MRGIPFSTFLLLIALVPLVETIAYLGLRSLIKKLPIKLQRYVHVFYWIVAVLTFGILIYTYSNPDFIRRSKEYTLFYIVIVVSILNLVPKSFYALATLFSLLARLLFGSRFQLTILAGSTLICAGIVGVIAYSILFGREQVVVEKHDLFCEQLPRQLDGLRIVQISDIHLGSLWKNTNLLEKTVKKINTLQPDLLLFTGDMVNNFADELTVYKSNLSQLSAKYGKYAILGNHDYGDYYDWPLSAEKADNLNKIKQGMTDIGFNLLLNQWARIAVNDTAFALIGVENWGQKTLPMYADLPLAMQGVPSYLFKILMTHDPAHWEAAITRQTDIALTLSGHTHGGQFGIKIAGISFSPIYATQKRWGGLYKSDNQYLYVNRGLGTVGFSGRIEMPPEITLITLHSAKSH